MAMTSTTMRAISPHGVLVGVVEVGVVVVVVAGSVVDVEVEVVAGTVVVVVGGSWWWSWSPAPWWWCPAGRWWSRSRGRHRPGRTGSAPSRGDDDGHGAGLDEIAAQHKRFPGLTTMGLTLPRRPLGSPDRVAQQHGPGHRARPRPGGG